MHRVAFSIFGFPIYSYGVMIVIGVLIGYFLILHRNKKLKITEPDIITDCFIWLLISGLAGGRIAYVILNFREYANDLPSILNLRAGGLTLYGALILGSIFFIIFCKLKKLDPREMLDLFAPSVLIGIGFGRVGCFLNGCCYGMHASAPFGVVFKDAGIEGMRYPVQIYEMLANFIGAVFLLYYDKIKKFKLESFILMSAIYASIRFCIEFIRESHPRYFGLSIAQYFSFFLIVIAIFLIVKFRNDSKNVKDSVKKYDKSETTSTKVSETTSTKVSKNYSKKNKKRSKK